MLILKLSFYLRKTIFDNFINAEYAEFFNILILYLFTSSYIYVQVLRLP